MSTLLVAGGCGFIGSNFIHHWREVSPQDRIINIDLLTYAGNSANLAALEDEQNYIFKKADICDAAAVERIFAEHDPDMVINFAAESHNSRAVVDPLAFTRTNILGTHVLLEQARKSGVGRFHQVSTCEVFGDMELDAKDKFSESSPYRPRTPYNASKAAADHIVRAYSETFGMPSSLSYCANNYGCYQHPEKLIPRFITLLLSGEKLTLYKSSHHKREWLHVEDHCKALAAVLQKGEPGCSYNIGSEFEMDIEEVADRLLAIFELGDERKTYISDRPGHDRRYLLDSSKVKKELGWQPSIGIEEGLAETVQWYRDNDSWWRPLLDGARIDEKAWR